jgi:hypothetical protein
LCVASSSSSSSSNKERERALLLLRLLVVGVLLVGINIRFFLSQSLFTTLVFEEKRRVTHFFSIGWEKSIMREKKRKKEKRNENISSD